MIIGSEYKLWFIIDRVPEWEDEAYKNGIMFVSLGTHIYPDTLRTTTLNMDLCYAVEDDSPFMKPVIDPVLYELEKDQLFKTIYEITYPEDIEKDNDYKYEWPFQEIMDAGFVIFSVSDGNKIKILAGKAPFDETYPVDLIELDMEDYLSITKELKEYVDQNF